MAEQQNGQSQVELKSSSSSMAGSDDSLDKSDLDDNVETQDNYKSFQNSPIILELGQKIGSDRSAFVRHGTPNSSNNFEISRTSPTSAIDDGTPQTSRGADNSSDINTQHVSSGDRPQQPKKRNPYSIEELLKKDERMSGKRPRVMAPGIVQPCGIIVGKEG